MSFPTGPAVPQLAQAVLYHRDPLGVLQRCRARFGPVFTLRFPLKDPMVIVADPGAIAELLVADPGRARAGAARRGVLPQASARSPFGADGDMHAATRRRMDPAFAPARIDAAEPEIAGIAERHVAAWPTGRPFRLLARMRTLTSDVFIRTVLAVRNEQRATALVGAVRHLLWTPGNPPLPVPGPNDGLPGRTVDAAFRSRRAVVARLLGDEIAERRARGSGADDLIDLILEDEPDAPLDAIVDELLIVMMAAQEPPSIALTNVVYELARRPALEPSAAVIDEVLRLRPSAQAVMRELSEPFDVAGQRLEPGTVVAISSLLAHRDPAAFPGPQEFRPGRFEDGLPSGAPFIPFGGGARRCIGEPLARAQFRAVLPVVLGRLRLRPASPSAERMLIRGTVLVPHLGGLVFATRR